MKGYDNIVVNEQIALDLTFQEGVGLRAHDRAGTVGRYATLVGPPTWTQTPLANLTVLTFDGASNYLECANAITVDLDFIAGDYTLAGWVNWVDTATSEVVMGRYQLDHSGWELYLTRVGAVESLSLRHHHASLAPNLRDSCYSEGWVPGQWWMFGITRQKAAGTSYPLHYRNGAPVTVTYEAGGLLDPDTCAVRDLVIGARFTKNMNWYSGNMWRPRIWSRCLSAFEMSMMFEMERAFFGV